MNDFLINEDSGLNIDNIINKVKILLDKNFNIKQKKEIKYYPNKNNPKRINFACPVCGDSESNMNAKRGNLYPRNLYYRCFNCDHRSSFITLCEKFNIKFDPKEKLDLYTYIDNNTFSKDENQSVITVLDKLFNLEEWIEFMNNNPKSYINKIKPIQKNSPVYQYLKYQRYIENFHNIYEGNYRVIKDGKVKWQFPVLINMNKNAKQLISIQIRNLLSDKKKRFFKIIEFEELYRMMFPTDILDDYEFLTYNKISHFFNILNVNFEKPVTIFEGYIDSTLFPNSIGMVGADNDRDILKFLLEADEDLDLRFFYDQDTKGFKKSNDMISRYPVFLWNKFFEYLVKNKKDKYKDLIYLKNNIIDLNNLAIESKSYEVYNKFNLESYFSKDEFDKFYLEKYEYSNNKNNKLIF